MVLRAVSPVDTVVTMLAILTLRGHLYQSYVLDDKGHLDLVLLYAPEMN